MLSYLRVQNLGILEEAELELGGGLTVITGETGTGKTLLLGALRLLTGSKPEPGRVGPFGPEARVEGLFLSGGAEIGVSRQVPAEGRSRAHLEGKVVSASVLQEEIGPLVELAGQHEHLRLGSQPVLLAAVDSVVARADAGVVESYGTTWEIVRDLEKQQEALGGDPMALERELDLLRHQTSEISSAGLEDLDDAAVDSLGSRLRNLELLQAEVASAMVDIEVMAERSGSLVAATRKIASIDGAFSEVNETAESVARDLGEILRAMSDIRSELANADEERAGLEDRLNRIGDLKRKYGKTVAEVLEYAAVSEQRISRLVEQAATASTLETDLARARDLNRKACQALTTARAEAANGVAVAALGHLADLGLGNATLRFEMEEIPAGRTGGDRMSLLFASDERLRPGPISDVASGGELSRLTLAVRLATNSGEASTLVFDEADAGIGGATALALGEKLAELAGQDQVIVVTHLPQVAAHADSHFVVDRDGDRAILRKVDGDARVVELSRMLAGLPDSKGGRDAAAELLATARR